jgi:trans-aconitate 2-methyltransferase
MNEDPAKDFSLIADDYVFFETHATEAEQDARAYARQLTGVQPNGGTVRMLDFGCGSGSFTMRFLEQVGWRSESVQLTLVEPADLVRRQATARLGAFTNASISESSAMPARLVKCFEVVLANHVFYYVPDLHSILRQLMDAVSPTGLFLSAIAGRTNALIQFWIVGFGLLGREIPYHTSEDVEAAFRELGASYEKQQVPYRVAFADNNENRMRIIRFLLADHLAEMPHRPLLDLFDQYSRSGRIEIQTASDHYTFRPGANVP